VVAPQDAMMGGWGMGADQGMGGGMDMGGMQAQGPFTLSWQCPITRPPLCPGTISWQGCPRTFVWRDCVRPTIIEPHCFQVTPQTPITPTPTPWGGGFNPGGGGFGFGG